jgi:surface protein
MYNLDNKIKQQYYNFRNGKDLFRDEDGAIDLASIMVGVIVIGLIGGVIAATVFAVIPWTQDNAAKQQLDSIVQAENAYFGLSAANPSPLPAGTPANSFGKSAELANAKLLITGPRYCVITPDDKKSYTGYSQSASGAIFTVTDKNSKPEQFIVPSGMKPVDALPSDCQFITEGMTQNVVGSPAPYVDPTPTLTTLTYKCDVNTTVTSPYNGLVTGKEKWSDLATPTSYNNASQTSRALTAGVTYQVTFDGTYTKFTATAGSKACLTSVDHWGANSAVTDASSAFLNTTKLTAVPDHIPSAITNMSNMFRGDTNFNDSSVSAWNVSNVTNMSGMFGGASSFNQDLSSWNTGKVTDLTFMFNNASAFNQDLSSWDTSSVKAMAFVFGQPYGTDHGLNWATQNTTISFTVKCTGTGSISFLSPIGSSKANATMTWNDEASKVYSNSSITVGYVYGGWNLRNVTGGTTYRFTTEGTLENGALNWGGSGMAGCLQSVDYWSDGMGFTNMTNAFMNATNLTNVPSTLMSSVTDLTSVFKGDTSFNDPNVSSWNVSNVTNMSNMFYGATSFNQPLDKWNTSKVTTMTGMFNNASTFNQNISDWNTSSVTNTTFMFNNASSFNQDLSRWNTGKLKAMAFMFGEAYGTAHGFDWVTKNSTISFTVKCTGTGSIPFYSPIGSSSANATMTWSDEGSKVFTGSSIDIGYSYGGWNLRSVTAGTTYRFTSEGNFGPNASLNWGGSGMAGCLQSVDYWSDGMGFTNMTNAFGNATNLTNVPSTLMAGITNLSSAFSNDVNFNNSNVSNWNISGVTNLSKMFYGAASFNQPLNTWNTANVTNMSAMFNKASTFNQDLSSWNTGNVTDMTFMFNNTSAFNQDLSSWDTSKVKTMAFVFGQPYGTDHGLKWATQNNTMSFTVKCASNATFYSMFASSTTNATFTWSDETSKVVTNSLSVGSFGGGWNLRSVAGGTTYRFTIEGSFGPASSMNWGGSGMAGCLQSVDYWSNGMNITNMTNAFGNATNLNSVPSSLMLGVTNLNSAFKGATTFNDSNVKNWDVSNVTNMGSMFAGATAFNQDVSGWNTSKVTTGTLFAPTTFPDAYMPANTTK